MIHVRVRDQSGGRSPRRPDVFLDMCFAYGLQAAVEHGDGSVVALRVTRRAPGIGDDATVETTTRTTTKVNP